MTDKEIKKALECCKPDNDEGCLNCPLTNVLLPECAEILSKESIALINRQQAKEKELQEKLVIYRGVIDRQQEEIEKLERVILHLEGVCESTPDKVRTEAIKEVFDRIDSMCIDIFGNFNYKTYISIKKEMVGEQE